MPAAPPVAAEPAVSAAQPNPGTPVPPATAPLSANHPGKAVYEKTCAACHDNPEATRAPALATLRGMRYGSIHFALTEGKMQVQGASLSNAERGSLIDYLIGRDVVSDAWIDKLMCAADHRTVDLDAVPTVAGFGFDKKNHRHLTKAQAGLATADFHNLEFAWALAFPRATTMRAQPAVVGNTLFLPVSDAGQLFAIDISGGPCFKWVFRNDIPLRTGAGFGTLPASGGKPARKVLVFGDIAAQVHMLDAGTGQEIWRQPVRLTSLTNGTGTPVLHGNRVYMPISASEITVGADEKHECCKTHGAVTALDAFTGRKVWTTHTMEEAKPVRDRGDGRMMWGPSGAPIWNSPSIDEKRGVLYVGTGEATSAPAAPTTDSVMALRLSDGKILWSFQATQNDIFLTGCMAKRNGLNCPKEGQFLDVDFGASTIIAQRANGKDVILAGQKSGTLWALDPDDHGKVLWKREFGAGSPIGGIHWGMAYDGTRVFAPINAFPGPDGKDIAQKPGMHAVNVDTGEVLWSFEATPDCTDDRPLRVPGCKGGIGLSGAPTVVDGAVIEGSIDGFLRVFDAATGEVLFKFDTARTFLTLNSVVGKGGAIDNASIVAANGYVFLNSGYGLLGGQTPGNVFLAFRRKDAE
ncbi:MAG: PQQ-binding-like beta-propeller repeat protein [Gammaproteobacteria bacterium]